MQIGKPYASTGAIKTDLFLSDSEIFSLPFHNASSTHALRWSGCGAGLCVPRVTRFAIFLLTVLAAIQGRASQVVPPAAAPSSVISTVTDETNPSQMIQPQGGAQALPVTPVSLAASPQPENSAQPQVQGVVTPTPQPVGTAIPVATALPVATVIPDATAGPPRQTTTIPAVLAAAPTATQPAPVDLTAALEAALAPLVQGPSVAANAQPLPGAQAPTAPLPLSRAALLPLAPASAPVLPPAAASPPRFTARAPLHAPAYPPDRAPAPAPQSLPPSKRETQLAQTRIGISVL